VQPVIDAYWRVKDLPDAGSTADWSPNPGQALQQFDMIEKGCAELLGGVRIVHADVGENGFEITQRVFGEEDFVSHPFIRWRASSRDTTWPWFADRMPRSMAARVASSSSSRIGTAWSMSSFFLSAIIRQ
jgi:hypothetical protein